MIPTSAKSDNKNILFIHHSTGGNLINKGKLRKEIYSRSNNVRFYDHGYNLYKPLIFSKILGKLTFRTGLSDDNGEMTGRDFNIFITNNSPKEYADIFNRDTDDETLKQILEYDTIVFKNCFPTSKIESEDQLKEYEDLYNKIRLGLQRFPNKKFIIFTQPPLRKEVTTLQEAKRARYLANYIDS